MVAGKIPSSEYPSNVDGEVVASSGERPDAAPPTDRVTRFLEGLEFATMRHGETTYVALADIDRVLADRELLAAQQMNRLDAQQEKR